MEVVHEVVCPACLGVLQAPEGSLQAVPSAVLAGLPEAEGNAGSWQTCTSGSAASLSQYVRYVLELRAELVMLSNEILMFVVAPQAHKLLMSAAVSNGSCMLK